MGLLADLVGLIANARADEPVRVALVGVGGSGKSELLGMLAAEPGVSAVDDVHDLDDVEVGRLLDRIADDGIRALVVAHRPALARPAIAELDRMIADSGRLVSLPPLDVDEARRRAKSKYGIELDADQAEHTIERTAGRPALFDLATSGAGAHQIFTRVATLGTEAVTVARVLAIEPDLTPTLQAAVAELSVETFDAVAHRLELEGLLHDGALVPLVAEATSELFDGIGRRVLHQSIADRLIEVEASPEHVATHLRQAGAVGALSALWFVSAASAALPDDPATAERWVSEAARAGAEPADLTALTIVIDAWMGRPAEAVSRRADTTSARSAQVAGYAMLGRWQQAQLIAGEIGDRAPIARWAIAMAGTAPLAESTPGAVDSFVDALSAVLECVPGAVDALARSAPLAAASSVEAPLPDEPIAVAALVACSHNRFGLGRRLLEGTSTSTDREQLVAAWIAMRTGSWRLADDVHAELDGQPLHPRDRLLADALDVALARRSGEVDRLTDALNRALGSLERVGIDLLTTEPVGEIVAAATRLGRDADVAFAASELEHCVRAADTPHAWRLMQAWYWLEAAVASTDASLVAARAAELQRLAAGDTGWRPVARAASTWDALSRDDVDEKKVGAVIDGLVALDWRWEASAIAGSAAIRTDDPMVARRLLERARTLKPVAPGAVSGDVAVDSPLTDRETEIAALVAGGATYKEIGAQLFISPKTVEHHVARIRQKLGATSRAELLTALRGLV